MIPLNKHINDFIDNYTAGKAKKEAVANNYVKLFTFDMTKIYKNTFVLFSLHDTQSGWYSSLVGLAVKKNNANDALTITSFNALQFNGTVTDKLYAIVTSTNRIEVYIKMSGSQSPAINIISVTKLDKTDGFGKVTVDCSTVVASLPSGTQKAVSSLI